MAKEEYRVAVKAHTLQFRFDAGTSRGILRFKEVYYIIIQSKSTGKILGLGEAAPLKGLSVDDRPDFVEVANQHCQMVEQALNGGEEIEGILAKADDQLPSLQFGLEMALLDFKNGGDRIYFNGKFPKGEVGVPINGLIWMNTKEHMLGQVDEKLSTGYRCIKMKIGAINFDDECAILEHVRNHYSAEEVMLRVDANGAFLPEDALDKLKRLAKFDLHSIEQPIMASNVNHMADLCKNTPLPIALDEELIGVRGWENKNNLLNFIKPQYIILKPTLLGGFRETNEWIEIAENMGIGWWVTSALESNIGLNAIAQYTAQLEFVGYQGLGTGSLYHNNIPSPLAIEEAKLYHMNNRPWDLTLIDR